MRKLVKIDAVPLAIGIQKVLLEMLKDARAAGKDVEPHDIRYPIKEFERLVMEQHGVSLEDAEKVTEKVINTGILRWELGANAFVL